MNTRTTRFSIGWRSWLARVSFTAVTLNYLRAGHTHEDVDQVFGILASCLRQDDIIPDSRAVCRAGHRFPEGHMFFWLPTVMALYQL